MQKIRLHTIQFPHRAFGVAFPHVTETYFGRQIAILFTFAGFCPRNALPALYHIWPIIIMIDSPLPSLVLFPSQTRKT